MEFQHDWQHQQADHVHDFDQRIDGRAGGVLQRIADGVTGNRSFMLLAAFASIFRARFIFNGFLGIIPSATGVRHEHRNHLTDDNHPGEEASKC